MKMRKHFFTLFLAICLTMSMLVVNAGMTIYADEEYNAVPEGTYILTNKESGKVLDVYGSNNSSNNKANVQIYTRQTESILSQQFQIVKTSNGWYNLIPNSNTGLVVNAYSYSPKNGTNVNVYTATNDDNTQGWYFEKVGDYYVIRCAYNKNIVMTETGTEDLSNVKLATYKSGKDSQLWTLELLEDKDENIVSGNTYILVNKESGKVLDVYGKNNSSSNKANVQVYTRLSGTCLSQQFQINKTQNGWFTLIPQSNTKLVVNAYSYSPKNGTNVNVYTATNDDSTQGWYFEKIGGYYLIRCAYNNNVVMAETGTGDLSSVKLATYESGKDSQLWALEPVKIDVNNLYNSNMLVIDWSQIAQVGNKIKDSYACSCFSLAYCRTILDGTVHQWYEYNKNRKNDHFDVSAQWSVGGYSVKYAADKNEMFKEAYNSINAGRPLIFYLTSKYGQHYVAVVGYTNVSDLDSLSESNFLIIDSVYGSTKSQATNLGDTVYKVGTINGKYSYLVTSKGGVETVGTTNGTLVSNNLKLVNFFRQDTNTCKATAAALAVNLIMGQNTKTTKSMISSGVYCANMNGNIYTGSDGNNYKTTYKTDSYKGSFDEEQAAINEAVSKGLPIVIAVHSTKKGGTKHHWILVVGKQGDDYLVVDPWKKGSGIMEDNVYTMSSLNYTLGLTDYSTPHYGYISFTKQ